MARKWIVEKGFRCCNNHRCNNYAGDAGQKCKLTLDPRTGQVKTVCPVCKQTSEFQASSWKEMRPCKTCGHVRNVTVRTWGSSGEEHAREECDACELDRSVRVHLNTAHRLQQKAKAIRARRGT